MKIRYEEIYYFAMTDRKDIFRGFILAKDEQEANEKGKELGLRVYGKKIIRSLEERKYGRKRSELV